MRIKAKKIILNPLNSSEPIVPIFHHSNIPIGAKPLSLLSVVGMTIIYSGLVGAMNSLVSSDDIGRMKKAKISDALIHSNVDRRTDLFRNG